MGVVVDDIMNYLTMYIYFITNCYIRPTVKRKNGIKYILALTNIVDRRIGCILISVHNDLRQSLEQKLSVNVYQLALILGSGVGYAMVMVGFRLELQFCIIINVRLGQLKNCTALLLLVRSDSHYTAGLG